MNIRLKLSLIFILFFSFSNVYGNRHEHYTSWLTASSITEAYEEIYNQSIGSLNIEELAFADKEVSLPESRNKQIFFHIYPTFTPEEQNRLKNKFNIPSGLTEEEFIQKIGSNLDGKTIDQVMDVVKDPSDTRPIEERRKKLFKLLDDSPIGKKGYSAVERLRINLYLNLKKDPQKYNDFLLKSFEKGIEKIPLENRRFIGFSVPGSFYEENLKDVKKLFESAGSDTHFYLSVPRDKLTKPANSQLPYLSKLEQSIKQGWGDGIDLTGSLNEADKNFSEKQLNNLRTNLESVSKTLSEKPNTVFRFHAFEAANKGGFYNELFDFMDRMADGSIKTGKNPPIISIGHIASLSDEDILKFQNITKRAYQNDKPFKIVFDANILSNDELQGTERAKIVATIQKLKAAGFEVGVGSDGSGILGKMSAVSTQVDTLIDNGLDRRVAEEIHLDSKRAPVCDINGLKLLIEEAFK